MMIKNVIKPEYRSVIFAVGLALILFLIKQLTIPTTVIQYNSMEPSLAEGERVLINKVVYGLHEPERGDVIIFNPTFSSSEPFIKRIIGLPGETIDIKAGTVYIHTQENTLKLTEPYIIEPPNYTLDSFQIPEGEYFVLGDNRNNSHDSHSGWTVSRDDIIAKAWLRIWPLDKIGVIENPLVH